MYGHSFYDDEASFRSRYQDIYERSCACSNSMSSDDPCLNTCHYLIADEDNGTGVPPVCGVDCEVEILCCGGDDIDNSTPEAHCNNCVAIRERYRSEQRRREEIESKQHREVEERRLTAENQKKRALREFWVSLSDLDFERECARVFIHLGFSAQTTSINNDGAIDILLLKDGRRGAAQCKAWIQPCGVKELREFYGALHVERMTFGYFISRSGITRSARLLLQKMPPLQCWTIDDLLQHAMRMT